MATRLVIEWTRTAVRLARSEGSGSHQRLRMIRSQSLGVGGGTAQALRLLLKDQSPDTAQVIGVIPREQVITRFMKFPSAQASELAQMVELYAKAQLPYPREQAVFDFHLIEQREGFSSVVVVACRRDVIDQQLTMLREAGLSVGWLTVSSWGVLGWYQQAGLSRSVQEPTLVVNVDDARADLVLIAEGRILSSRSIGQGAQDWEGAGNTTESLVTEIERSRAAIRKELPATDVRSIVLTGLSRMVQLKDLVAQRLGLPVAVVDGKEPLKEWPSASSTTFSPVVLGGLASSETHQLLNLSPVEMRDQVRHRQQVKELAMVTGLLIGVLALGSLLLTFQISRNQQMAAQLDHAFVSLEPQAKQLQEKTRSAQLVLSVLNDRRRLASILASVFHATPASVSLEVVSFERTKRELTLRGNAASLQEVLEYLKQLKQLDGVEDVNLKYSTGRTTMAGPRTDFEMVLSQRQVS